MPILEMYSLVFINIKHGLFPANVGICFSVDNKAIMEFYGHTEMLYNICGFPKNILA